MDQRSRHARDLQRQIGEVLLRNWDPLSVADEPECADEYNAYVGPVYRLLESGASDREIAKHLVAVETNALGFPDTEWRMLIPLAQKLQRLYRRWRAESPAP